MRHRVQKWTVGPERRKGLGTSRADVSGNARHFCDGELNFTGYEGKFNSTGCEPKFNYKDGRKTEANKNLTVRDFLCFVVFRPQSLLDFLKSRAMKRKSINHCAGALKLLPKHKHNTPPPRVAYTYTLNTESRKINEY